MSKSHQITVKDNQPSTLSLVLNPIRKQLAVASLLTFLGTMLTLIPLAGIAHLAKIILNNDGILLAQREIWWTVTISVSSLLAGLIFISTGELVSHLADNRITHHLRHAVAQRLARVPLGWFTDQASGEVKQAMQDDIATLHSLTAHFYTAMGRAVGAISISVIYLLLLDWRMTIITLLPFAGFFLFLRHAMQISEKNSQEFVARMGEINNATIEFISGIPVIKAFGTAGKAHNGYHQAVDAFSEAFIGFTRPLVSTMAHAHALLAPVTVLTVVLGFGALFIGLNWITPVDLLPFVLVAPGMCAPLLLLHTLLHDLGSATGAAQRLWTLLDTPLLEQIAPEQQQTPNSQEIRFEQVSYAYRADHPVVSKVSFTLEPGKVTAIVGSSGAGKSTLARLMLRFFDPDEGCITLGGVDLRHIETTQLYQRIGFVLQEVRLIHASLYDNIALGRPSASRQEIEAAARAANIHDLILALPRGYDSVIGEDAQLSGGERQRVSIARAMLLDSPILVLDEATAAADTSNEIAIQKALSHFAQGRTLMVIAHRLDTIMHADHILVMEDGSIVEQGKHRQLLAQDGRYAQLWKLGGYESATIAEEQPC